MAGLRDSRMLSVMSSIKCAGCGKNIDMMALGDHVCEANLGKFVLQFWMVMKY
jgi:hypothetical protein